jgi:hypothetical protein
VGASETAGERRGRAQCQRCGLGTRALPGLTAFIIATVLLPGRALAQGHGPAYGLSTPTLGRGDWSVDVALMGRLLDGSRAAMLRTMLSYGITEDVQLSTSLPMPLYTRAGTPAVRGFSRMPASPDVELLLGWRFHRRGTDVGTRRESTLWIGFGYPTDAVRSGVRTSPGLVGGVVTGYASRSVYVWAGALYRRYMAPRGPAADQPGDAAMASLVLGYRPPGFREDYPRPDWRAFVEILGEHTGRDVIAGVGQFDRGNRQLFAGATLLGLYGSWGVSGGPVFPVYRRVNGDQPRERARMVINTTFWF